MGALLSPVKGAVLVLAVCSASDSKHPAHRPSLGGTVLCGVGRNFSSSSGVTFLPFLAGSSVEWGVARSKCSLGAGEGGSWKETSQRPLVFCRGGHEPPRCLDRIFSAGEWQEGWETGLGWSPHEALCLGHPIRPCQCPRAGRQAP